MNDLAPALSEFARLPLAAREHAERRARIVAELLDAAEPRMGARRMVAQ